MLWYSKESSQRDGSFQYTEHMFKLMDKLIFTVLRSKKKCFAYQVHKGVILNSVSTVGNSTAIGFINFISRRKYELFWERSGSVVECLTRDRRAAGSSLTGVTALCP